MIIITLGLNAALPSVALAKDGEATKSFNLPAGDAAQTLKQFAAQAGREIVFSPSAVATVKTNEVKGDLAPKQALDALLADTGLAATQDAKTGAFAVRKDSLPNAERVAQTATTPKDQSKVEASKIVLDAFEVMGSRVLNMDKPRSRDDAQPYVVFNRQSIEQSGATSIEDFLKQRLTMETTQTSESQTSSLAGSRSTINLRGLGTNQTLILVDGHRTGGSAVVTNLLQADINGIPLGAVERIEILPTSASGIYGGGATGGVVNIILRRDYAGVEVKVTYDNSFRTDSAKRRVDLAAGFNLEGGKTNILLAASFSDGNSLLARDRDFLRRGRANIAANSFDFFLAQSSPPLGYTTNMRSLTGANLTLKPAFGGTVLNSSFTSVPVGYAGPASDNAAGLVANSGKYNLAGANAGQGSPGALGNALLNTPVIKSFSATIRRQFTPDLQMFVDVGGSSNEGHFVNGPQIGSYSLPATAPNNPFVQSIRVVVPIVGAESEFYSLSKNLRTVAGVITKLPGQWQAGVDLTYERSSYAMNFPNATGTQDNLLTSGALDIMRDVNKYPIDWSPFYNLPVAQEPIVTEVKVGTLRASGPVGHLPAGRPTISTFIEHREEILNESRYALSGTILPKRTQTVKSIYAEAKVPLVSPRNEVPLINVLELQLAGRLDDYTTNGSNTPPNESQLVRVTSKLRSADPTIGLRYVPVSDVMLRASYSTGFLPPNVSQFVARSSNFGAVNLFADPKRGNEFVGAFTFISGGSPNLKPELSKTRSAGVVLTPHGIPGLRFSIDWSKISKRDNVSPLDGNALLALESSFPDRVIRGPKLAGDPAGYAGPVTALNVSLVNVSRAETAAFDFALDYERKTQSAGTFSVFANATRTTTFKTQLLPSSPLVENVGTVGNVSQIGGGSNYPLKFKGNFGVNWKHGRWSAGWAARYYDSYAVYAGSPGTPLALATILAQGNGGRVPSQTYHDVYAGYSFGLTPSADFGSKLLSRTEVKVGVRNIFNTEPPYDVSAGGRYYSSFVDPRVSSYYISVKKSF